VPDKILIVDDDKDFRYLFKDYLEGYDVIEAASGEEALGILKKPNEIDLVILDVMLPGVSGTDVLRQIKKSNPDLGVIILTAYASQDLAVEALRGHADDFIEKGMDIEDAEEIICKVLESKKAGAESEVIDLNGKIAKVKRFVERNCYKKISLNDVAKAISLSPKYLSRLFKQVTRMKFSDYKLSIKIGLAKDFLKKSGYNINQVADKLGYKNVESFIRQFKKSTGMTPTEFRKNKGQKKI